MPDDDVIPYRTSFDSGRARHLLACMIYGNERAVAPMFSMFEEKWKLEDIKYDIIRVFGNIKNAVIRNDLYKSLENLPEHYERIGLRFSIALKSELCPEGYRREEAIRQWMWDQGTEQWASIVEEQVSKCNSYEELCSVFTREKIWAPFLNDFLKYSLRKVGNAAGISASGKTVDIMR